jgi:hypothetical protein
LSGVTGAGFDNHDARWSRDGKEIAFSQYLYLGIDEGNSPYDSKGG